MKRIFGRLLGSAEYPSFKVQRQEVNIRHNKDALFLEAMENSEKKECIKSLCSEDLGKHG